MVAAIPFCALFSSTARAEYRLVLVGPSLSLAASGESIEITGQGTFDPETQQVQLRGAYRKLNSDGAAIKSGEWKSVRFGRFQRFDSKKKPNEVGGVLEVTANFVENGRFEQRPMKFVCLMNKPDEFGDDEGVTVGEYIDKSGGLIRITKK